MSTRCRIALKDYPERGSFGSIYCHFDGYLSGVGQMLLDHYNNSPSLIKNLLALGDISSLEPSISETKHYAYKDSPYCVSTSYKQLVDIATHSGAEFLYVFDPALKQWSVAELAPPPQVPLKDALLEALDLSHDHSSYFKEGVMIAPGGR